MCEYNFKNPIWGIKKGGKNKKEYELILKNVSVEFEFALRVEDTNDFEILFFSSNFRENYIWNYIDPC